MNCRPETTDCEAPAPFASSHFTGAVPLELCRQKAFTCCPTQPASSRHGPGPVATTTPAGIGGVVVLQAGRKPGAMTTPLFGPGVHCAQFPVAASNVVH